MRTLLGLSSALLVLAVFLATTHDAQQQRSDILIDWGWDSAEVRAQPPARRHGQEISGCVVDIVEWPDTGSEKSRRIYLSAGAWRPLDPAALLFLGTVAGMPIYVQRSSAAAPRNDLRGKVGVTGNAPANNHVYIALNGVPVLYIPVKMRGCSFQPLKSKEPVPK